MNADLVTYYLGDHVSDCAWRLRRLAATGMHEGMSAALTAIADRLDAIPDATWIELEVFRDGTHRLEIIKGVGGLAHDDG